MTRNDVNTASAPIRSGASGSRRREAPKVVTQRNPHSSSSTGKPPVLFRGGGVRLCTLNVRSLNYTGAAALLDIELRKFKIAIAGLQEVRWPGSGEMCVGGTTFLWSGRQDGGRQEGVALAVDSRMMSTCVSWTPASERIVHGRFRHSIGYLSVIAAYAPTEGSTHQDKEAFYEQLGAVVWACRRNDLILVLGDFNAVSGSSRLPGGDTVLGPWGSGQQNDNTDHFLSFSRNHRLSIAGSWFRRKDIHRFSWISNDGRTKKEIDHILSSQRSAIQQCRVYRTFDVDSDHLPVIAVLKTRLKRHRPRPPKPFRPDLDRLHDHKVRREFAATVSKRLQDAQTIPNVTVDGKWGQFRDIITSSAREVIGERPRPRKPWISQETLAIIERRRMARQRGDLDEHKRLTAVRRRAVRYDKQMWADRLAAEGEEQLSLGNSSSAFANFRRLRGGGPRISGPIQDSSGNLISDQEAILDRWKEHFAALLNRPVPPPPVSLKVAAYEAAADTGISTDPPTLLEVYKAITRLKAGKAPGICGIYSEYLHHAGSESMRFLVELFNLVWESDTVPEEWRQGIIIPIYKGKGSRSDCSNYRGITLLSVPGKVFAHTLLARIKPTLLACRRPEQSGFTPNRSTVDRILTLCILAQRRQEFGRATYSAYVDLRAAFDSLSRPALWLLLARCGIPQKIIKLIEALYDGSTSSVRIGSQLSPWFPIVSGVRQGCVIAPDAFATGMDWLLERSIGRGMNGVTFGPHAFTDLDFADDVSLLAELLELLVPLLEIFHEEAAPLGLEVNWRKTMVQALGSRKDEPSSLKVCGHDVERVETFTYLGAQIHSSCSSEQEIRRRIGMTRTAMQSLDHHLWRSRITVETKLRLYNVYILPITLYGSECWTLNKADIQRIDALDQWCLRRILGIRWNDFVRNDAVRSRTQQPQLSRIVQSRRLSLFGHVARMSETMDANRVIFDQPLEDWKRPRGRPRTTWLRNIEDDIASHGMGLSEARVAAQNRPYWRMLAKHGATRS